MKPLTDIERAANEIYLLFREHNGAVGAVSLNVGNRDSSKLSRQISISDDRRDNPFVEVLEILRGTMDFSPDLEVKIWQILERERGRHRHDGPNRSVQLAELISKVFPELGDVVFCNSTQASQEDMEREAFQLLKAVEAVYNEVKNRGK